MRKAWAPRAAAFFLWALAALTASHWAMRAAGVHPQPELATVVAGDADASTVQAPLAQLAQVFGPPSAPAPGASAPAAAAPDPAARMRLVGVVANRAQTGVALIAFDGQAARPYRVGSVLEDHWKLQRVDTRSATLVALRGNGAPLTLELGAAADRPAATPGRIRPAERSAAPPPAAAAARATAPASR